MIVKVCGITTLDDALLAVNGGADAVGFNFYTRSPRYIDPDRAREIANALPASIWKVGVFVNEPGARQIAMRAGMDVVQLHGDETPNDIPSDIRVWKAFRVTPDFDARTLDSWSVEAFLLDTPSTQYGGTGHTFDWTRARLDGKRIIIAGGLDSSNVQLAIRAATPWGVDTCSRIESSPGRKDPQKLAAFLAAAKATA